jgi:hypothetical protein
VTPRLTPTSALEYDAICLLKLSQAYASLDITCRMPTIRSKRETRQSRLAFKPAEADDDDAPPLQTPRVVQTRLSSHLDADLEPRSTSPLASSQVNNKLKQDYSFGDAESSGDDVIFTEPHRVSKVAKRKRDDFVVPDDESSEDDVVMPSRKV